LLWQAGGSMADKSTVFSRKWRNISLKEKLPPGEGAVFLS
jgi:hypothetical protein